MTDIMQRLAEQEARASRVLADKRTRDSFKSAVPPEAMDAPNDDRKEGLRSFQGMFNVLAFVAVIAALVGLYLVLPA